MKIMKDEHKVGYQYLEPNDKEFLEVWKNLHSLNYRECFTIFVRRICINWSYVHLNVIMTSHGLVI